MYDTIDATMYDAIIGIANDRVVVPNDFAEFIGKREFMTVDHGDVPTQDYAPFKADNIDISHVVEFEVRRVLSNGVEILAFFRSHPAGIAMNFDADELAIRMEDA